MAVNRPLVGELTPVTLLVCNGRLPSHSPGQLMSFSQKSDEQVVAVQLGSGRADVLASRNCPHRCIWLRG